MSENESNKLTLKITRRLIIEGILSCDAVLGILYFVQAHNINIIILQSYEQDNTFLIHTPLFISKPSFIAFLFSIHRFLLSTFPYSMVFTNFKGCKVVLFGLQWIAQTHCIRKI